VDRRLVQGVAGCLAGARLPLLNYLDAVAIELSNFDS
jgi:hypothetical protein